MFIPDAKLEEIRAASDVVDVVSDYVRLKKRGSNYFGLCPFHSEKTPSFSVNPGMGIFKCFGCGAGGDVFQFVMRAENLGFVEAVRTLAERAGIPLPEEREPDEESSLVESVYNALRFAARYFYDHLTQDDAGKPALQYLKDRGIRVKTIKQFGLGYAPDAWDGLIAAATAHHITEDVLEKAGLIIPRKGGGGYYDRYRGRVIFPIFSHVGKVLGFGGRILTEHKDQPKYINTPQTLVYDKSRVLYGLHQGKREIRRSEEALLVEGYTDVLSLHQAGVTTAVASSGTALTREQIKILDRYAKRIVVLYDADAAGANAAVRAIDLVLRAGLSVYAVELPAGDDPDTFVRREGGEAFKQYVGEHRRDFVTFRYEQAHRDGTLGSPEGQATTMHGIIGSIALIPDPLMRETYTRRASDVLNVPDIHLHKGVEERLFEERRKSRRSERRAARLDESQAGPASADTTPPPEEKALTRTVVRAGPLPQEKALIRLMLEQGKDMVEFVLTNMGMHEFTKGPARSLVQKMLEQYDTDAIDKRRFLDGAYGTAVQELAAEVVMNRYEPSENWERRQNIAVPRLDEDPYESAASAMTLLKLRRVNEALEQAKQRQHDTMNDEGRLREVQAEIMKLHDLRRHIERRAFLQH